ncbi:hypothetical protein ACFX2I_038627 [Malus domestica]
MCLLREGSCFCKKCGPNNFSLRKLLVQVIKNPRANLRPPFCNLDRARFGISLVHLFPTGVSNLLKASSFKTGLDVSNKAYFARTLPFRLRGPVQIAGITRRRIDDGGKDWVVHRSLLERRSITLIGMER